MVCAFEENCNRFVMMMGDLLGSVCLGVLKNIHNQSHDSSVAKKSESPQVKVTNCLIQHKS